MSKTRNDISKIGVKIKTTMRKSQYQHLQTASFISLQKTEGT